MRQIAIMNLKNIDGRKTLYIQTSDGEFVAAAYTDEVAETVGKWNAGDITDDELLSYLEVDIDSIANSVQQIANTRFERLSARMHTDGMHIYIDGDGFEKMQLDPALEAHMVRMLTTRNNSDVDRRNWESFVAFTENLYNNTDPDIRVQIFAWMEAQKWLTLTDDGCIIGYKGCQKNPDTGIAESINVGPGIVNNTVYNGHLPNPDGAIVEISKSLVTKDPACGCASGLHVGTYDYAADFAQGVILKVKMNPRDIVSVPYDCSAQKVRCCRYEVLEHTDIEYDPNRTWVFDVDDMSYCDDDYDEFYPGEDCDGDCRHCDTAFDCAYAEEIMSECEESECDNCMLANDCPYAEDSDDDIAFDDERACADDEQAEIDYLGKSMMWQYDAPEPNVEHGDSESAAIENKVEDTEEEVDDDAVDGKEVNPAEKENPEKRYFAPASDRPQIFDVIENPSIVDWSNVDQDTVDAVIKSLKACDGKDGRPDEVIALEFFNKILDLNAGKIFKETLFGIGGIGSYFKRNIPEGMTRREWLKRFNETIKKFRLAERCG